MNTLYNLNNLARITFHENSYSLDPHGPIIIPEPHVTFHFNDGSEKVIYKSTMEAVKQYVDNFGVKYNLNLVEIV